MATPAIAVLITRKLIKDTKPLNFSPKFLKDKKALAFSALLPSAAIFFCAILFYIVFPDDLDFKGTFISENFAQYGVPANIEFDVVSMLTMGLIVYVISAIIVPYWFISLGEDIGWQGYMLPMLCEKMPVRCAVVLNGALWGLGHAPLIYWGFNYGTDYMSAPFGGIVVMTVFCMVVGVWMSYITFRTKNCMYAGVIHGSVNLIGEVPIWLSLSTQSTLFGPNPTGIIGMSVLLIGAMVLLIKMPSCDERCESKV